MRFCRLPFHSLKIAASSPAVMTIASFAGLTIGSQADIGALPKNTGWRAPPSPHSIHETDVAAVLV